MSDKFSRPISTRLLLVAIFSVGLIYGVSHIPKPGHSHDDAHGHGHDGGHDAESHDAHGEKGLGGH